MRGREILLLTRSGRKIQNEELLTQRRNYVGTKKKLKNKIIQTVKLNV